LELLEQQDLELLRDSMVEHLASARLFPLWVVVQVHLNFMEPKLVVLVVVAVTINLQQAVHLARIQTLVELVLTALVSTAVAVAVELL
jgi:hypothetical protein